MAYTRNRYLTDLGDNNVSTSTPYLIADFTQLTLSVVTTGAGSPITVQISNDHGLNAALGAPAWSTVTVLANQGIFGVETGARWLRVARTSASSATCILSGLVNQ